MMQLDDAWIGCSLDPSLEATGAAEFCRQLIGNGCDIVACPASRPDLLASVAPVCRTEDALLLLIGPATGDVTAHGVLLEGGAAEWGAARAQVDDEAIIGSRVTTPNDAALALELGVGFLLYSGQLPVSVVGSLPGAVGVPLFVGGDHAPGTVDASRYRLWVEAEAGMEAPACVLACSQALGRVV